MLPSVSAGSAALTKYAQALAVATPETAHREANTSTQPEQDAARQNAESRPHAKADGDTLAREARATVENLIETMRLRVLMALLELDIARPVAEKAAAQAAARLGTILSDDSRHAAQIVHSLLEPVKTTAAHQAGTQLFLAARDLTIIVDHRTGQIEITLPRVDIFPGTAEQAAGASPQVQHLVDFTDSSPDQATPVLSALGAVYGAAREATNAAIHNMETGIPAAPAAPLIVSPDAFTQTLVRKMSALLVSMPAANTIDIPSVAGAISRIIANTINAAGTVATGIQASEIAKSIENLQQVAIEPGQQAAENGRILIADGKVAIALDPANGSISVKLGKRITAFAPASLPVPAAAHAPLPGLQTASIPIADIPPGLPTGKVVDYPGGIPFIPPVFDDIPLPGQSNGPLHDTPQSHRPMPASAANHAASVSDDDTVRLLDPTALRHATIVRGLSSGAPGDGARLTQVSLDVSAEIGLGAQSTTTPSQLGALGRPRHAPPMTEAGPVMETGYADAAAHLIPVLPAWHARGLTQPAKQKRNPKQLPKPAYRQAAIEDAFTRDMPDGHQGLVFTSVVFSV